MVIVGATLAEVEVEATTTAVVEAAGVEVVSADTPRAALKASAAASPVSLAAAVAPALHAVIWAAEALHLSFNCWQMKLVMTLIPSADPSTEGDIELLDSCTIVNKPNVLTVEVRLICRLKRCLGSAIESVTASESF